MQLYTRQWQTEELKTPPSQQDGTIYTSRFWKWLDKVQNSREYKEYGTTNLRFNIEPTNKGEKSSAKVLLIKKERKVFVTGFIRFFNVGPRLFLFSVSTGRKRKISFASLSTIDFYVLFSFYYSIYTRLTRNKEKEIGVGGVQVN